MMTQDKLPAEIHKFVAIKIRDGLSPSGALRDMHSQFGEQSVVQISCSLSEIYGVRAIEVLTYLGHWWFDSTSSLTDEQLDQYLFRVVSESKAGNDA